jgi:hypothetical protein
MFARTPQTGEGAARSQPSMDKVKECRDALCLGGEENAGAREDACSSSLAYHDGSEFRLSARRALSRASKMPLREEWLYRSQQHGST